MTARNNAGHLKDLLGTGIGSWSGW